MIASSPGKLMQSASFSAKYQSKIASIIEFVVIDGTTFIQSHTPHILSLQLFQRAHQIRHPGNAYMLSRARSGFHHRRIHPDSPAFG